MRSVLLMRSILMRSILVESQTWNKVENAFCIGAFIIEEKQQSKAEEQGRRLPHNLGHLLMRCTILLPRMETIMYL